MSQKVQRRDCRADKVISHREDRGGRVLVTEVEMRGMNTRNPHRGSQVNEKELYATSGTAALTTVVVGSQYCKRAA